MRCAWVFVTVAVTALVLVGCGSRGDEGPIADLIAIDPPAQPGSLAPNLSVSPSGRVYLTWIEPLGESDHALSFSVLEGSRWDVPRTVARGRGWLVNWADFPSLLPVSDDTLFAHWLVLRDVSREAYDIHVARSTDGGATWSGPVVPHRDGTQSEHGFVSMWPVGTHEAGLVWLDGRKSAGGDAGEMTLRSARMDEQGALHDEVELDGRVCDCCQTAAATTADGPVIAYRDRDPSEIRDISVVRLRDRSWTPPMPASDDRWQIAGCPVNGPALDARGTTLALAWFTAAGNVPRVFVSFSRDSGATFEPPIRVDDDHPLGRVAVGVTGTGRALVSWLEQRGDAAEIRVRGVTPGLAPGAAAVVASTSAARVSGFPRMRIAGDRVVFAWTEPSDGAAPSRIRSAVARIVH